MHERRISDTKTSTLKVALQGSTVRIGNLDVHLDAAAEYLRGIPAEKLEAAFVHAVQVGMNEIMARRRRFQTAAHSPAPVTRTPVVAATPVVATAVAATPGIQPKAIAPPEPKMEAAEEFSIEARSTGASAHGETEGWLRRLDDDFDSIDPARALDASRSGR
jgi:hypothetical protein